MAVPNTSTFTLVNVVNEVNPTSNDLVDCFADAVANKFDSAYSGSKNNLLNFRNYEAVSITAFSSSISNKSQTAACPLSLNQTYYHSGSSALPITGDTVWTNAAGTTPLGITGHYRRGTSGTFQIGSGNTGTVINVGICV